MLKLILIALLAGAAGEPVVQHATPAQEPPAASASEAPGNTPPTAATAAPESAPREPQYRTERRCEEIEITGRRMPQRVCRNVRVLVEDERAE